MNLVISFTAIILAWIGFFVKLQFPFLTSKQPFIVYLKQKAYFFIIASWIIVILDYLFNNPSFFTNLDVLMILIPSAGIIFIRFFILYDKIYPKLVKMDEITIKIDKLIKNEPEVAVLQFIEKDLNNKIVHIYPLALLRVGDIVYKSNENLVPDYSLTFCLLCNTAHAYHLPGIKGKKIEITSNNGTVLNGNKILADKSGKLVWQQFTGKGLNSRTINNSLQEIPVKRYVWEHAVTLFPNSYVYHGPRKFLSKVFFNLLSYLVRKYEIFSFSLQKSDPRLKRKALIFGIEIDGNATAYPVSLFDPVKPSLIEDRVGNQSITLIFDKGSIIAFLESDLLLKDGKLIKNDKKWSLIGQSLNNEQDLKEILVTEKSYWYMWSKFHPNTKIFTNN